MRLLERFTSAAAVIVIVTAASSSVSTAGTHPITVDTYLNSYLLDQGGAYQNNQITNYGRSGAIKAVSNDGSGSMYPTLKSIVHGLFKLPDDFWTALGNDPVTVATVSYAVGNDASLAGRGVELHPLTRPFTAGGGSAPNETQAGNDNPNPNPSEFPYADPPGADWLTSDGTTPWTTPGGDFDATFVLHTKRVDASSQAWFDWNIASLINNPTTRDLIHTNGLFIRVTNETNFVGNQFVSLRTYDWSTRGPTFAATAPTVSFTALPEPAVAGLLTLAAPVLGRRPRRSVR